MVNVRRQLVDGHRDGPLALFAFQQPVPARCGRREQAANHQLLTDRVDHAQECALVKPEAASAEGTGPPGGR